MFGLKLIPVKDLEAIQIQNKHLLKNIEDLRQENKTLKETNETSMQVINSLESELIERRAECDNYKKEISNLCDKIDRRD